MSLSLTGLSIYHRQSSTARPLMKQMDLTITRGEIVTLMGPSGCGKSTLLSLIAGHLSEGFTFDGQVFLGDEPIHNKEPHTRSIGILFQDDLLFPHLNVWENIAFALPNTIKGKQRHSHALNTLSEIGLIHLANAMPHQISGGQRARISLSRMLSAKPKAVLLDEPFSKLDPELRVTFRHWVFEQLIQANIPTLMVTHDSQDVPENGRVLHWETMGAERNNVR